MTAPGRFVWFDLFTNDPERARIFYSEAFGWKNREVEMAGGAYHMFLVGDKGIGGASAIPPQAKAMGAPPHWLAYVTTDNVDATCEKILACGGQILAPATDIVGVGRFAVAMDPQGGVFAPFKGAEDLEEPSGDEHEVGGFCWHELMTSDIDASLTFYGEVFGWSRGDAMDMGEKGTYQMFNRADVPIGGVMVLPEEAAATGAKPHWLNYTVVADIDQSVTRIQGLGGRLLHGPAPVPGGQIAALLDPTGATFAVWAGEAKGC